MKKSNPLTIDEIVQAIRKNLSPDLLSAKWAVVVHNQRQPDPVAGHCAIATEALYDMLGGVKAGYTPVVCSYYDDRGTRVFGKAPNKDDQMTHWWLKGPCENGHRGKGDVIDPTVRQYKKPFPYENGKPTGFMSPNLPFRCARILIDRVEKMLGAERLQAFRKSNIKAYQKAGGRAVVSPASQRRYQELKIKAL